MLIELCHLDKFHYWHMCQVFQNNESIVLNVNSANMAYRICTAGMVAN